MLSVTADSIYKNRLYREFVCVYKSSYTLKHLKEDMLYVECFFFFIVRNLTVLYRVLLSISGRNSKPEHEMLPGLWAVVLWNP